MRRDRVLPPLLILVSFLGCAKLLQYYLVQNANQFSQEFERQNYSEIGSADTFKLAQKLDSLAHISNWECARATRSGLVFFEYGSIPCVRHFLTRELRIVPPGQQDIEIQVILTVPQFLLTASMIFLIFQFLTLFALIGAAKRSERVESEKDIAIGKIAAQVAHDIFSPLSALKMIETDLRGVPSSTRIIIQNAVQRISDIAENLLHGKISAVSEEIGVESRNSSTAVSSFSTLDLIEGIVLEKRLQLRENSNIQINLIVSKAVDGAFARVQSIEFKRVVSNLLNNAVDAVGDSGFVAIFLNETEQDVVIKIQDNGKGMSKKVLAKVGERGFSHGKKLGISGFGLGVAHAKAAVTSWGGFIYYESSLGKGTEVTVGLPRTERPKWFVSKLLVRENSTVVAIDDDSRVLDVWKQRFLNLHLKINFSSFTNPDEIIGWYRDRGGDVKNTSFLIDSRYSGSKLSGIEIIEMLGIADQSILVTGGATDIEIQAKCVKLGLKLLPKSMISVFPIEVV